MAVTLRHTKVCSRYLSPCRLAPSGGSQSQPISHHCASPNSSSSRNVQYEERQAHSANTTNICDRSNSFQQHQKHSFSHAPSSQPVLGQPVRSFKTCQQSMSDTGTKNRGNFIDLSSATRMVGSLNIDLPKGFKLPQKLFQRKEPQTDTSDVQEPSKTPSVNADVDATVPHERVSNHAEILSSAEQNNIKSSPSPAQAPAENKRTKALDGREQHDFYGAMKEQHKSINTYYKSDAPEAGLSDNPTSPPLVNSKPDSAGLGVNSKINNQPQKSTTVSSTVEGAANLVKTITNYIPGLSNQKREDSTKEGAKVIKKNILRVSSVPRSVVDRKTKGLVKALRVATSSASQLVRMEELCRHMTAHPECKSLAVKEKVIPCLLRLRANNDLGLREQAMETLALVGYTDSVKGRGIRILSLDGGGTRGLVAIEILRRLEEACQCEIHKMFDYICGVSTGSLIGVMLAVHKLSLDEAEHLYKTFSREIFQRHKLMGVGKLVMSHGYYDAALWEKILQENIGLKTFLESTRAPNTPKVASVSTLMNLTKLSNFLFRNYNHPPGAQSQIPGSCKYAFWEAIRASSAAPGYYQEYKLDEWIHQDGGIITNNPTAIAVHESKLLWPSEHLQCVVSIGTGRYEPTSEPQTSGTGLRDKITKIVQSATDTEAVHTTLHDLLPPSTYFRFNPYMSEDFLLDEIRPDRWDQMKLDTGLYCRKNQRKIDKAAQQLMLKKLPHQRTKEWLKYKATMLS